MIFTSVSVSVMLRIAPARVRGARLRRMSDHQVGETIAPEDGLQNADGTLEGESTIWE